MCFVFQHYPGSNFTLLNNTVQTSKNTKKHVNLLAQYEKLRGFDESYVAFKEVTLLSRKLRFFYVTMEGYANVTTPY